MGLPGHGYRRRPLRASLRESLSRQVDYIELVLLRSLPGNHNRSREAEAPVVRRLAQADFQKGYPFAQSFTPYLLRAGLGQLTLPVCRPFVAAVVHPRPQRGLPGTSLGDLPMELQPRVPALEL